MLNYSVAELRIVYFLSVLDTLFAFPLIPNRHERESFFFNYSKGFAQYAGIC